MKRLGIIALALALLIPSASLAQNGVPISQLPVNASPVPADIFVNVHAGVTSQVTGSVLSGLWVDLLSAQTIAGTKTFLGTINLNALTASSVLCLDGSKNVTTTSCPSSATLGANTFTGTQSISSTNALAFTNTGTNIITSGSTGVNTPFVLNNNVASPGNPTVQIQQNGTAIMNLGTGSGSISLLGTTANTFASATTGANTAFIFTANGAAPTGDIADFKIGGATKFVIGNAGQIQGAGSSTLTTLSSIPPLYSQTGTALTNAHSAFGSCTISTGTNPTCTATLSGTGNVFTSATSYACSVSTNGLVITSSLPNGDTNNTSGTVTVVDVIGIVTTGGTAMVVCTGT